MLKRFFKQRRSVAALEFALVAPLLVALLFGVYDLSNALITYEEVYAAAHSMAASISNEAVQSDGTNSLTYSEVQQGASLLWGEIPALRSGLQDGVKSVTVSSIVFENTNATCTPTVNTLAADGVTITTEGTQCDYVPVVVWSITYMAGDSGRTFQTPTNTVGTSKSDGYVDWTAVGTPLRSCLGTATSPSSTIVGSLNQSLATAGSSSDLTNLRTYSLTTPAPSNPAPPSPILVVDVNLDYQPVIGMILHSGLNLWVSAYWPVRSVKTSVNTVYPLYEEFTTLTPDVPATATKTKLTGYAANNYEYEVYDANGTIVSTNNYCVNTSLYNAASFPYPAETQ
jgi:Flp pilus assembly protein TadG